MSKTSRFIIIASILIFTLYCLYPTLDYYYLADQSIRKSLEGVSVQTDAPQEDLSNKGQDYQEVFERLKSNRNRIIKPGLDFKGGLFMILQADFEKLKQLKGEEEDIDEQQRRQAIDRVMNKIQSRLDVTGVSEISMRRDGTDRIIVQIPGETTSERIEKIISTTGSLEFKKVHTIETANLAERSLEEIDQDKQLVEDLATRNLQLSFILERNSEGERVRTTPIVLEDEVLLSGNMLRTATLAYGELGEPIVSFSLNSEGARLFGELTAASIGERIAIVLDGEVVSAPSINTAILGGEAQISGGFSQEEARDLSLILRAGSLPVPVKIISKDIIGAKLSAELKERAVQALSFALMAVIVFMIFYYRLAGVIACIGLVLNAIMVVAFLSSFGLSISLSGVAGLLLTIGMSIDANVIIFERIREEHSMHPGDSLIDLIHHGYQRAFWSIFDANITTLIAAFVLFYYGSGVLQGFATTLFMGIIISMFTSLFFTRYLFDLLLDSNVIKRYSALIV